MPPAVWLCGWLRRRGRRRRCRGSGRCIVRLAGVFRVVGLARIIHFVRMISTRAISVPHPRPRCGRRGRGRCREMVFRYYTPLFLNPSA